MDLEKQAGISHEVVLWDLASEEEGTGIVHIAPGCGAEDFDLGKKEHLPAISPLDDSGVYMEGFGMFSNKKYSEVSKEVLRDLEQRRFVYKTQPYKHRYPHCWRCGSELVFRMVDEWYISAKEIRAQLIKENKKIEWFPEYGKIRQEEWFKNMSDWLISRKRYWGLPLPIWECSCGKVHVIGSLEELKKKATEPAKVDKLPELHRPWIDDILINCDDCKKPVQRIKDVGDAWLDAGIVPFSTLKYLTDRKYWESWFPADFISENMPGQYRGWFNALFWASVALTGKAPFKSILGYETLKDERGEEMHKSKGNAIWFDDAVKKIGADPMRLLYCLQDPDRELRFGYTAAKEPANAINILYNLSKLTEKTNEIKLTNAEDLFILSKLNSVIKTVTLEFESIHPHKAAGTLYNFWLSDVSRGYVQLVRDRLADNDKAAQYVMTKIFVTILQLCAPIIPFISEHLWQELKQRKIVDEESVHLSEWPKADETKIDIKLEEEFEQLKQILEIGLAERDKAKIGLKWPLASAAIVTEYPVKKEMQEIIARQLNVKKIISKKGEKTEVVLDTVITSELEAEGYMRELARKIQAERKKAGFVKTDIIPITIFTDGETEKMLVPFAEQLQERVNAKKIEFNKGERGALDCSVKDKKIFVKFS